MKKIGIYHYQYYRGACKLCYRHFIQEMVESYEKGMDFLTWEKGLDAMKIIDRYIEKNQL